MLIIQPWPMTRGIHTDPTLLHWEHQGNSSCALCSPLPKPWNHSKQETHKQSSSSGVSWQNWLRGGRHLSMTATQKLRYSWRGMSGAFACPKKQGCGSYGPVLVNQAFQLVKCWIKKPLLFSAQSPQAKQQKKGVHKHRITNTAVIRYSQVCCCLASWHNQGGFKTETTAWCLLYKVHNPL